MTLTMFITLLTFLSLVSSLMTEAIKKAYTVTKPTLVVAIISAVAGWGGGVISYIFMHIPFNTPNIICIILLAPAIFLSATLGYDKVLEIILQVDNINKRK